VWPVDLSTVYDAPARFGLTLPSVALPMAFASALAVAAIALRRRAPGLLAGGLVFFVLLAPTFAPPSLRRAHPFHEAVQPPTPTMR